MKKTRLAMIVIVMVSLTMLAFSTYAQQMITINLTPIDGVPIRPDNILNYQIQASKAGTVQVKGRIRYRSSGMFLSYSFSCMLSEGLNRITSDAVYPQWQFSSGALQDLFFSYKVLPEGTYEYCVTIIPGSNPNEQNGMAFNECLYYKSADLFLINLVDPPNKAKLKEYNPLLTWVANCSFANELTYRIRVAEMKQGQNPVNAALRNQSVYDENNLMQNSIVYPVYAKPLQANQPYAWTVDAYYKGILLGGSEAWEFIIPDDTVKEIKTDRSHIDIKRETGANRLFALGKLKLKYVLDDRQTDMLSLELTNDKGKKCSLSPEKLKASYGDNRYEIDLEATSNLKHKNSYILWIKTETGHEYKLPFQYLNPQFTN